MNQKREEKTISNSFLKKLDEISSRFPILFALSITFIGTALVIIIIWIFD